MSCADFERWLDAGAGDPDRDAALRHAAGCARCAAALEGQRALEDSLAFLPPAPPAFTDRVMARVAARERAARAAGPMALDAPALPWWIRAAADPAAVLAALLGGLVLIRPDLLSLAARWAIGWSLRLPAGWSIAWPSGVGPTIALALVGAALIWWASDTLFRWTLRLASRAVR